MAIEVAPEMLVRAKVTRVRRNRFPKRDDVTVVLNYDGVIHTFKERRFKVGQEFWALYDPVKKHLEVYTGAVVHGGKAYKPRT